MSSHDIIMAMVDGLEKPRTEIKMEFYGIFNDGICYGCAATNAILHIMDANKEEVEAHIMTARGRHSAPIMDANHWFLTRFERALDRLRQGEITYYNDYAIEGGFAQITPIPDQELPCLNNDYTEKELQEYVKLAKYQLTA